MDYVIYSVFFLYSVFGLTWGRIKDDRIFILRWTIPLTYSLRNPRCSCSGFLPRRSRRWSEPWGRRRRKFWPWARCAPAKDKPTPPSYCAPSTSYESETEKIGYLCTRDPSNAFVRLSAKSSVGKAAEAVIALSMCLPFMSVNARHCSFCYDAVLLQQFECSHMVIYVMDCVCLIYSCTHNLSFNIWWILKKAHLPTFQMPCFLRPLK